LKRRENRLGPKRNSKLESKVSVFKCVRDASDLDFTFREVGGDLLHNTEQLELIAGCKPTND